MSDAERLCALLRGQRTLITISTFEEGYVLDLVRSALADLNRTVYFWSHTLGVTQTLAQDVEVEADTLDPAVAMVYLRMRESTAVHVLLDLAPHLAEPRVLRGVRDLVESVRRQGGSIVMIDHDGRLPAVLSAYATPFEVSQPSDQELDELVRDTLKTLHRDQRIDVQIKKSEYNAILRNLRGLSRRQVRRIVRDVVSDERKLDASDIQQVITEKRKVLNADGLLEFVETPTSLDEVGGLASLKTWLGKRAGAAGARAAEVGLPTPRGLLLLGVQGAGKSLSAKAIGTAMQRPLLRLDPGSLYNKYIGESERRLREALAQAETMAPVVLWIDEIEKGFASAASESTDGGLSRRMFGSLLTWMQDHRSPVFLVATANDIAALPPELMRKGRFDEIFFVDLPRADVRATIFKIHLSKRKQDAARFDLQAITDASEGYSGSEIEQAVIAALYDAIAVEQTLTTEHVIAALRRSPPLSVTMAERIDSLRLWARDRCVPAD